MLLWFWASMGFEHVNPHPLLGCGFIFTLTTSAPLRSLPRSWHVAFAMLFVQVDLKCPSPRAGEATQSTNYNYPFPLVLIQLVFLHGVCVHRLIVALITLPQLRLGPSMSLEHVNTHPLIMWGFIFTLTTSSYFVSLPWSRLRSLHRSWQVTFSMLFVHMDIESPSPRAGVVTQNAVNYFFLPLVLEKLVSLQIKSKH